jgi:hypothetical protein
VVLSNGRVNLLTRLFASQEEIMKTQWDLLTSNSKNPTIIAFMKENLRQISDGSSSHHPGAVKAGLKMALDLKMCVRLSCSRSICPWYTSHVPPSFIDSNIRYCQLCVDQGRGLVNIRCAGCLKNTASDWTSCQTCGKRFM